MCLLTTMFMVLMPKFIEEGRLVWLRAPLYKLEKGKDKVFAYTSDELSKVKHGRDSWDQTRFKGLGELGADDMTKSMCHPNNRKLEVLTLKNKKTDFAQLKMLMGEDVEARRNFIFANVDFSSIS